MQEIRNNDSAVRVRKIRIHSEDGAQADATAFAPEQTSPKAVIVCTPAIGMAARYYESLGRELARLGFCAVTADLRGVGSSTVRARRGVDFGYRELIAYDLPAVIAAARAMYPTTPLLLLGHSIGAHISAMYASVNPGAVRGLIYVAAGTSFYKNWEFPGNLWLLGAALLTRSVSAVLGYFPGRTFRLFGTEARRLMQEWSALTTGGRFNVTGGQHDFEQTLPSVTLPILALSFEGDHFAPVTAVRHLLAKTPRAATTETRLRPADLNAPSLDHFRWTKYPVPLAAIIGRWIVETPRVLSPATS